MYTYIYVCSRALKSLSSCLGGDRENVIQPAPQPFIRRTRGSVMRLASHTFQENKEEGLLFLLPQHCLKTQAFLQHPHLPAPSPRPPPRGRCLHRYRLLRPPPRGQGRSFCECAPLRASSSSLNSPKNIQLFPNSYVHKIKFTRGSSQPRGKRSVHFSLPLRASKTLARKWMHMHYKWTHSCALNSQDQGHK
jgi:hypothetical protein